MKSNTNQYILLFSLFEAVAKSQQLSSEEEHQLMEKMDSFLTKHGLNINSQSKGRVQEHVSFGNYFFKKKPEYNNNKTRKIGERI